LDVEIALASARKWGKYVLSFDSVHKALSFTKAMTENAILKKRNIAVFDAKGAEG